MRDSKEIVNFRTSVDVQGIRAAVLSRPTAMIEFDGRKTEFSK